METHYWPSPGHQGMTMTAFICDYVRTPIGRFGGSLSSVRTDDLGAVPIRALMARHPNLDWAALDEVIYGCANQAGEDNRNVARMVSLLAGLPIDVPGTTVNRLCGSGMDAVILAARGIKALAHYLENRAFLGGDRPCGADASVFATLNGLLTTFFTSDTSAEARRYPVLAAYVARMNALYFPNGV